MKKIIILTISLLSFCSFAKADNDTPISVNELPQKSRTFIQKHFPEKEVAFAKMEKEFWDKSYEVVFVNGEKVEFNKNGEWKEIKCHYSTVPANIIPEAIRNHITKQYPEAKVLKIERDTHGYEVKLNNRLELKYNLAFQWIGIDD